MSLRPTKKNTPKPLGYVVIIAGVKVLLLSANVEAFLTQDGAVEGDKGFHPFHLGSKLVDGNFVSFAQSDWASDSLPGPRTMKITMDHEFTVETILV